jgi:hypothetical protein
VSPAFWVSYVLLWVLVAALFIGVLALYHHFGEMYLSTPESRSEQGLEEGTLLKATEAFTVTGAPLVLPADRPTLLLFVSTTCDVCKEVRAALPRLVASRPQLSVVVVCVGRPAMVKAWAGEVANLVPVIADQRARIGSLYNVDLTPFCIAVGADGHVRASGIANTYDALDVAAQEAESLPIDDHSGHDHSGHDHSGHDHSGHDHSGHGHPSTPQDLVLTEKESVT